MSILKGFQFIISSINQENMQKIASNQLQIKGWEDQDETEQYISFYNKLQQTKYLKFQTHKTEPKECIVKIMQKKKLKIESKNTRNQKHSSKLIKQYKLKQSEELKKDKVMLLSFLKQSVSPRSKKKEETARTLQVKELDYEQKKQKSINPAFLGTINSKKSDSNQKIFSLGHSSFKNLFQTVQVQKKYKPTTSSLKNKSLGQKNNKTTQNFRGRRMINFYYKSVVQTDKNKEVEKFDCYNVKPKSFPLYFRQMEQKLQQQQRNLIKARRQFKLHKKKYKSQSSMHQVENQQIIREFTDENIMSIKKQVKIQFS